jgi:lipopolysaccharide export system permease protein
MKTIHRSIFGELLGTFAIGLFALNVVLMAERVFRLMRSLSAVGAPLAETARIVLYLQPQLAVVSTPMALLLAVLLTYGRLNAESELVVLRASGMSFRSISRPVFALGALAFLASGAMSFFVAPAASQRLRAMLEELITQRAHYAIQEGIFNDDFKDVIIYTRRKPAPDAFEGVFIYDRRKPGRPIVVYAREGRVLKGSAEGITFRLTDGHIHMVSGQRVTDLSFGSYDLLVPVAIHNPTRLYNELTPAGLLREARGKKGRSRVKLLLEFHRRLSLPALCLLLMLFAPPLAMRSGRTGRMGGLVTGFLVFAAYYAAVLYGENLALSGHLPVWAAAWMPAAALGTAALLVFHREEKK